MFAGLPGIGVGTLFYVLTALWMPVREFRRTLQGQSSPGAWRLVGVQFCFAIGIVASVAAADRVLLWLLGASAPGSVGPAHILNHELASRWAQTVLAAPVTASLLLLGGVLLIVELLRVIDRYGKRRQMPGITVRAPHPAQVLDSSGSQ